MKPKKLFKFEADMEIRVSFLVDADDEAEAKKKAKHRLENDITVFEGRHVSEMISRITEQVIQDVTTK